MELEFNEMILIHLGQRVRSAPGTGHLEKERPRFLGFHQQVLRFNGWGPGWGGILFFEAVYLLTIPKSFQVCSLVSTIYIDFLESKVRIISQ